MCTNNFNVLFSITLISGPVYNTKWLKKCNRRSLYHIITTLYHYYKAKQKM